MDNGGNFVDDNCCNDAQRLLAQVAVALNNAVYLWSASSGETEVLMQCAEPDDYITSVKWAADGKHLAIGLSNADLQLWDADRAKQIRSLKGHAARVSAVAWNGSTLSSGGRDSVILNHDVRCIRCCDLVLPVRLRNLARTLGCMGFVLVTTVIL